MANDAYNYVVFLTGDRGAVLVQNVTSVSETGRETEFRTESYTTVAKFSNAAIDGYTRKERFIEPPAVPDEL